MPKIEQPRERFWQALCSFQRFWWMLAVINIAFLVVLLVALLYLYTSPSAATSIIAIADAVIIVTALTALVLVLRKCNRRQRGED